MSSTATSSSITKAGRCGLTQEKLEKFNWVTEEGRCKALCEDGSKCGDPYSKHATAPAGHQTPQKTKEEEKIGSKSSSPTKPLESTHYDHINMQKFWNGIKHATIVQHPVDIDSQYIDDTNDDNQPSVSTTVQVKADVLDIGGGSYVFGDKDLKLSKLLIRDHYVNLWNIIEQEVKTRMPKWIVTGTPGIGKSCFLAYMLYKLSLIQEPNQLIIWCSNAYGKSCIFHSDGNVEVIDGGDSGMRYAYREGYLHESTWLLSDDVKPKFSPCKILLVSSPNTDVWKDFEKQYAERRYLPVWSPREILLAHRTVYSHLTTKQVLDTLSLVGGIPRRIFNVMEHFNATNYLKEGLLKDFNHIEMYCDSVGELCHTTEKANHRLLHMGNPPGDTSYTEGRVLFASSYVASLIANKLEQKNANDIMKIVNGSEGAGKMGAWRGQLFEGLVHNHLSKGGPLTIRSLHDGHEEDIDIKIDGDVVVFNSIDELEQVINTRNVYAHPKITNYESIDCLITPNYLFQSTVSGHHDIKVHGLKLVTQSLQKHCQEQQQFKLIFVVPPDRYDDWQKIQCYKTSTNTVAKHPPTNVTQWVMSLNLSNTKLLTPNKGKRSRDSSLSLPSSTASPSSSPSPSQFPSHPSPPSVNSKRQKQLQSQHQSPAQVDTTTTSTAEQ